MYRNVTTENVGMLTCEVIFQKFNVFVGSCMKVGALQVQSTTLTRIKSAKFRDFIMQIRCCRKTTSFHKELRYCIAHLHMPKTTCGWIHIICYCHFEICICTKGTKKKKGWWKIQPAIFDVVTSCSQTDVFQLARGKFCLHIWPWRLRQDVPLKWSTALPKLHDPTTQTTTCWIWTAIETSNLI
jgi:hypothetical protein